MVPCLGAQAVRKIQQEQPGKGMHPASDVQERKIAVKRLQQLIELIDRVPMRRQLIECASEIGLRRPEPSVTRGTNGLFVAELIALESSTGGRCACKRRKHDGTRLVNSLACLAEVRKLLPTGA